MLNCFNVKLLSCETVYVQLWPCSTVAMFNCGHVQLWPCSTVCTLTVLYKKLTGSVNSESMNKLHIVFASAIQPGISYHYLPDFCTFSCYIYCSHCTLMA
ncbi:hypothetical protein BsWGS_08574 [Bradybaena similaris]